jgi:hypothetical protein
MVNTELLELNDNDEVPEYFGNYNDNTDSSDGESEYGNDIYDSLFDTDQVMSTSDYDPAFTPTSISLNDHNNLSDYIQIIDENNMLHCMINDTTETYSNSKSTNSNVGDNDDTDLDQSLHLTRQKVTNQDEMLKWLKQKSSNDQNVIKPTETWDSLDTDTRVQLVTFSMELKNRKFQTSSEKIPSNKQQPTISEVSNLFSLSAKQHAFFATIALILLKTWNDRELDKVNEIDTIITFLKTQQKLIYLTGEGGTGKSRCIEALQFFCNQWGRPDAIAKTALTGKAAVGVEGKFII